MIAIINDGANLYGAIAYNYEKVKTGNGCVLTTNRIILNINPDKDLHIPLAMESFEPYLLANLRTSKPVTHISINPDIEDKLTDDQYILLAEDYLERMNFGDQPYIIYKHTDIDRVHLHVITTRIGEEGNKKVSDSHEWPRNKKVCRELEVKHGLKPISDSLKTKPIEALKKVDYGRGDIKRQISNTVKTVIDSYRFQSFGEYNAVLSCFNINVKQVKGEEPDYPYKGIIYSAMNEKGETCGVPIKSSRIGKMVGYAALEKKMERDKELFSNGKIVKPPVRLIAWAMRKTDDLDYFREILKYYNMEVVLRVNDTGRIYGVTFINHADKTVFNGSRLGKEFSANVFNERFNLKNDIYGDTSKRGVGEGNPEVVSDSISLGDGRSITEIVMEWILEDSPIQFHGEDLEQEFRKNMRKKKGRRL